MFEKNNLQALAILLINSLSYFAIYFILFRLTCRKGWIQSDKRNIDLKSRNSKIGGVNQKNGNYKYFHKELTNANSRPWIQIFFQILYIRM